MTDMTSLSQKELFALALDAAQRDDRGRCLVYLKEAAERPDATAQACFMLGSEYAQLQMMDEAQVHLRKALDILPSLGIARFQLGLLLLTCNQPFDAQAVWAPLADGGDDDALAAFHKGMLHLIKDEFADALQWLERGVVLNTANAALNRDMQMVMEQVRPLLATPAASQPAIPEAPAADDNHLFLNIYQRGKAH